MSGFFFVILCFNLSNVLNMKNKILLSVMIVALLFSCKKADDSQEQNKVDSAKTETVVDVTSEREPLKNVCYKFDNGKDVIEANLLYDNGKVSGNINYNLHEKDKNSGNIIGSMNGDTIIANYIFMSEGVESFRQLAFLKKGNALIEGYGDIEEKDGRMVFKDIKKLNFPDKIQLKEVPCK